MEWKREVNTNLGITIILVFAAIFTIIDFYVVCSHIDGYPFNELSNNVVDNSDDDTVVEEEQGINSLDIDNNEVKDYDVKTISDDENDMSHYVVSYDISYDSKYTDKTVLDSNMNIRTVKDQVFLGDGYYGFLSVDDGKLNMSINRYSFKDEITYRDTSFETVYLSHSFDGENAKYIYYNYFQPSGTVVIWAITDAGNVYLSKFKRFYSGDVFDTRFFDIFEKKFSNVVDLRIVENVYNDEMCPDGCTLKGLAIIGNGEPIEISIWGN